MAQTAAEAGFFKRFAGLTGAYWRSGMRWKVSLLLVALVLLTIGQVIVPVLVNLWSKELFDALEQHSMRDFLVMVMLIGGIIVFNIANTTLHMMVKRRLQLDWRQWMTKELLGDWLTRGRHHQVTYLPGDHDNPDGRIAEDIRISTEFAVDLGHSLLYCSMLLISFTQILWTLSGAPEVTVAGITFAVPGYLVYIALLYAAAGTTLAILLGRPLVRAVNRRQGREADFRFGLVRVRENALAIALLHAESDERRNMFDLLRGVKIGWNDQTRALANVTIFSSAYSVLSTAFPILVVAPRYISGSISLGVLMQTAQAFQQMAAALSWPVDNLGRVAECKASIERVLGLHEALKQLSRETSGEGASRILVDRTDAVRSLSFRDLAVNEPDGRVVIKRFNAEIMPGERVLIAGDPGAAIRLFRAVARVWPWGSGQISLPCHTRVFFMPQRPYLPRAPLRTALGYPTDSSTVTDVAAAEALERVGLHHLVPRLDEVEPWKEVLAVSEQQRFGFARLLLRRPDWIFIEDATDALDPAGEEAMMRILDTDFSSATLLTIGSHAGLDAHHGRKFVLTRTHEGVEMNEVPLG
ncbi:MAG: ABC transporter ATP-binding protein/permease [Alphaproteobacteria bacterium]|nr:ABC transporter ATP-binding protein/permease [Alphaproteobacteria bacterium]